MEQIQGKTSLFLDTTTLTTRLAAYGDVWIDLGTGDGRFVLDQARAHPRTLMIGIDACREHLVDASRRAPANALYLAANALALPSELAGLASRVTINFPWGSLLEGLLSGDDRLLNGIRAIGQPGARLDVRLNSSALAAEGWTLTEGSAQVRRVLQAEGWAMRSVAPLDAAALREMPTTWAKRMAFGRDPHAVQLTAVQLQSHGVLYPLPLAS